MMTRTAHQYYFYSLVLHALVLLMFVRFSFSDHQVVRMGDHAAQWVTSYIEKSHGMNVRKKVAVIKEKAHLHTRASVRQETVTRAASTAGKSVDALLSLLHSAIQKQQHYPDSAMEMERQGRATLSFILFPDGTIQQLQLLKSSGTESLDTAAIAAIRHAVPFQQVSFYLHAAKTFSIDVVFSLGD